MYYIIYPIFYVISLIPWRIMYFISDGIYLIVYYLVGYRKKLVLQNLAIAFPEKTKQEHVTIAKEFYHNFIDTFLEMIKLISISDKELSQRFSSNMEVVNSLYDSGINIQLMAGHFFNWEIINLGIAKYCKYPFVGVYMPLTNKAFNKIVYNLRSKYNTILVPATKFSTKFHVYVRNRYVLGLAADQAPGNPNKAYWITFLNKLTPFISGPEKGAKRNNTAFVFSNFYKVKRGYYKIDFEIITTEPRKYADGVLTKLYAEAVEKAVRKIPSNYLWSHNRWKHEFIPEKHNHLIITSS